MNKEDKQRILIHYLTRLMAKSMDMSDAELDRYNHLLGTAADVRFKEYWNLNEAEKKFKKEYWNLNEEEKKFKKEEGIRQGNEE